MTQKERWQYCLDRRKELEQELRDAELLVGLIKKHMECADRLIEDIRTVNYINTDDAT